MKCHWWYYETCNWSSIVLPMQKLQYEAGWMAETGCRRRWLGNMGMFQTQVALFYFLSGKWHCGQKGLQCCSVCFTWKHIIKSKRNFFKLPGFEVFVCNNPLVTLLSANPWIALNHHLKTKQNNFKTMYGCLHRILYSWTNSNWVT